jgi:hypothetical protein
MKEIHAPATTPHGAMANVHRIAGVTINGTADVLLIINSYADETTATAGTILWQGQYPMPYADFTAASYPQCIWDWICTSSGLFVGGELADETADVEKERAMLMAWVTNKREKTIARGLLIPGIGRIDTDPTSIRNVQGAVQAAVIASSAGQPFSVDWRLSDNTTATLDASQMITMGIAVTALVTSAYEASWSIKEALSDPNLTIEQLRTVDITTAWPADAEEED